MAGLSRFSNEHIKRMNIEQIEGKSYSFIVQDSIAQIKTI